MEMIYNWTLRKILFASRRFPMVNKFSCCPMLHGYAQHLIQNNELKRNTHQSQVKRIGY